MNRLGRRNGRCGRYKTMVILFLLNCFRKEDWDDEEVEDTFTQHLREELTQKKN